jgi:hypothetical protein
MIELASLDEWPEPGLMTQYDVLEPVVILDILVS